jgi:hypothetical protein
MKRSLLYAICVLGLSAAGFAQEKPADIRIVTPRVDKAAQSVTLPAAFWNEHLADWLDVAFCGRPSDFLHETVACATTTRGLLEQALRDVGCYDADAWVDGVQDFPRIRGDRLLITLEFIREGKKEKYSLDELITLTRWGVPLGPFGFMFKGDPDHAASKPAVGGVTSTLAGEEDSARILRDDPQIALVFRGIRSMSQSFADHPLAYVEDRWEWEEIHRARNHTLLPAALFDSNGKTPVTLTFQRVSEEQLLTQNAALWHDDACRAYIHKQLDIARQLDKEKAAYLALRLNIGPPADKSARLSLLAAQIERDYAALDAAWTAWAVDHLKPTGETADEVAYIKEQARHWGDFMAANMERAQQLALAAETPSDQPARALVARSRALIAENKPARDYWQAQSDKIKGAPSGDTWANTVRLRLALINARMVVGGAGVDLGQAQQQMPPDEAKIAGFKKALDAALGQMTLADARLALVTVEFEISKREGSPAEAVELAKFKKQRDDLRARIQQLESP